VDRSGYRNAVTSAPPTRPLRRPTRVVAASILCSLGLAATAVVGSAVPASAAPGGARGGGVTIGSLRAEAGRLSAALDAEGARLDQLAEQYDAAVIRRAQLDTAARVAKAALATTQRRVLAARRALIAEAVAAYMSGATPLPVAVPGRAGYDPMLTEGLASAIGGDQHQVVAAYEALSARQSVQARRLQVEQVRAEAALATLDADRAEAQAAQQADDAVLSKLRGRLAAMVEADQAAQAEQQARTEQAVLASEGQRLPGQAPNPGRGSARGGDATTSAPTSVPAASSAPTTTPTTATSEPTTGSPPATDPPTTRAPVTTSPTSPPSSAPPSQPAPGAIPPQAPGAASVLAYARAQLGKPYVFGAAGPDSFDCSGLVMRAWETAGIDFPHYAQYQYDLTARIPLADLLPGDLVFFGTGPQGVGHVGIYVGGGEMIDAPETGLTVSYSSIYWTDLVGGGRVTVNS
jgi:cell wall-associated NlpC family hydrolase